MKRTVAFVCAAALALGSALTARAAEPPVSTYASMPSYSTADGARSYRHATAAYPGRNSVEFSLSGNTMTVKRRSFKLYDRPDRVIITRGTATVLEQEINWASPSVGYYGYDGTVSLSGLGDGTYTLTVKSSDGYIYTVNETQLIKSQGTPYFPKVVSTSKQYNFGALQRLYAGQASDDFAVLQEQYGTGDDRATLTAIRQKALELTRGCATDRDKVMAIDWWISQNIAYDMDLPGAQFDSWVAAHPGDKVRLDSPLNAFTQHYAVCYGFARLNVLMLGYAGVESVYITGRLAETTGNVNYELGTAIQDDQMNHAWNAVKVDGGWYFLDSSRNVVKQYYRTVSDQPSTGYTESKLAPSYLYVFPDQDFLSETHLAMRMGAKNAGTKISPQSAPDGWQNGGGAFYYDSAQLRSQWARIDGVVYYFDSSGNACKGWRQVEGYWRYFNDGGALVTGTLNYQDGAELRVYQLDGEGRVTANNAWVYVAGANRFFRGHEMLTGWQFLDSYWRYFDREGAMYQNAKEPLALAEGEYSFTGEGCLQIDGRGWVTFDGRRHYLDGTEALTGPQRIDGKDYLLDWDGSMLTGWQTSGGSTYLLGNDGLMLTGWQFLDGSWYYLDRGQGRYTGVQTVGGKRRYFDAQGRLSTGGWVDIGTVRLYYADSTTKDNVARGGKLLRGWRRVDDKLRYFDPLDGAMYTGGEALYNNNSNKWYTFDANGVATERK